MAITNGVNLRDHSFEKMALKDFFRGLVNGLMSTVFIIV